MDESPNSAALGDVFTSIEVTQVIVRACVLCGGPRTLGEACADCGNLNPPVVHDLGQTTGVYRDSGLRGMWERFGRVAAEQRIRKANAQAALLRRDIPSNFTAEAEPDT